LKGKQEKKKANELEGFIPSSENEVSDREGKLTISLIDSLKPKLCNEEFSSSPRTTGHLNFKVLKVFGL